MFFGKMDRDGEPPNRTKKRTPKPRLRKRKKPYKTLCFFVFSPQKHSTEKGNAEPPKRRKPYKTLCFLMFSQELTPERIKNKT